MLQCWQTKRTFVIKTLSFFPTKALNFFEKKTLLLESKTFVSKTNFLAKRMLIWQPFQKRVTKNPRKKRCTAKKMNVYQFFCRNNFPWKAFLDTPIAFSTSPIEKTRFEFRREKLWIRNEKKSTTLIFSTRVFFIKTFLWTVERQCEKLRPNFSTKFLKEFTQCPKYSRNRKIFPTEGFLQKVFWRWKMQLPQICKKNWPKVQKIYHWKPEMNWKL